MWSEYRRNAAERYFIVYMPSATVMRKVLSYATSPPRTGARRCSNGRLGLSYTKFVIGKQKYTVQTYPKHSRSCSETKPDPRGAPPTPHPPRAPGHSLLTAQSRDFCVLGSHLGPQNLAICLTRQQHRPEARIARFRQLSSRLVDSHRGPRRAERARWIFCIGLGLNAPELRIKNSFGKLICLLMLLDDCSSFGGLLLGRFLLYLMCRICP